MRYIDPTGETATVATSCTTHKNEATTCRVTITATIAIYAAKGSGIDAGQLDDAAATITKSIDKAWSGSFEKDGVAYNVTTDVAVSVVTSQSAGEASGAQNVIGLSNGPVDSTTNANAGLGPLKAISQDFNWALQETTTHINDALSRISRTGTNGRTTKDVTTVGAPRYGDWK